MGVFGKIFGTAVIAGGLGFIGKKIKDACDESKKRKLENDKRKSIAITYDPELTYDDFERIAIKIAKQYRKLHVTVYDGYVKGTVRTASGNTWDFALDFNNYGKVTGWYCFAYCENDDSSIPNNYANELRDAIKNHIQSQQS